MHLQFGEIPSSLSLLLKEFLGMQSERSGGYQVVKEIQSILAGVSLELRSAGYKKRAKKGSGETGETDCGMEEEGVKPWLDPASAQMEDAKLHPSALSGFWIPWL